MPGKNLSPAQLNRLTAAQTEFASHGETARDPSLLRLLSSLNRATLSKGMVELRYEPGDVIFEEGERGDALYVIWSGQVAVVKGNLDTPTILGYRGPGEIIGEMALLEHQPRSATNIAVESSRLLRIDREKFQHWIIDNPSVGMSIMSTLSARLRDADTIRTFALQDGQQLERQVVQLETEKEQLLELQRVRKETSDLVVHDLRNPLGIIYGVLNMLEMVLPESVLQENRELLNLANTACERMRRLVDSLLDVAKLETGEMVLSLANTNLKPVLEDAATRQGLASKTRGISFEVVADDDLPPVLIDVEKIDRVLSNLIDNALKYTPNDEAISIAAQAEADMIAVSVTDAGPGIPPAERERIFERFAQVSGDKTARRGFGLGLTFCRLTIEAHGGKIWVEAGPDGKGSRFIFTLPLSDQ